MKHPLTAYGLLWTDRWWKWLLLLGLFIMVYAMCTFLQPLQAAVVQLLPLPSWMPDMEFAVF
jgi:hypothetical protein